jgi:hypothetical protein
MTEVTKEEIELKIWRYAELNKFKCKTVNSLTAKDLFQKIYAYENRNKKTLILERFFGIEIKSTDKILYTKTNEGRNLVFCVMIKEYYDNWKNKQKNSKDWREINV